MKMHFSKLLIATALVYGLSSCDGGQSGNEHHDDQGHEHHDGEKHDHEHTEGEHHEHGNEEHDEAKDGKKTKAMESTPEGKAVNKLLMAYIDVKDALVNDEAEMAASAATVLKNMKVDAEKVDPEPLKEAAGKIASLEDIEKQRESFEKLTGAMEGLISKHGLSGKTVYKQYCPMAFDNKGANWFAVVEDINNPYFGSAMLHCGTVQETLEYK